MKPYMIISVFAGALAGCSQQDVNTTKRQLHQVGQEAKQTAHKVAGEIKKDAHEAAGELKKGAHQVSGELQHPVDEIKREVGAKPEKDPARH